MVEVIIFLIPYNIKYIDGLSSMYYYIRLGSSLLYRFSRIVVGVIVMLYMPFICLGVLIYRKTVEVRVQNI